jgi:sulfur relay (sulfurtransferase) DsrC/TusE family protein
MAKINVHTVAEESKSESFGEFTGKFQESIKNLTRRQRQEEIQTDRDYDLDSDGYIIGDIWSEAIASEIMLLNGFQPTIDRINLIIEGRDYYGQATAPTLYTEIAIDLKVEPKEFLKMFPKFPVIYFTRWGNLRKPSNMKELRDNPIRK